MTNEEYTFKQTVSERKRNTYGARHKKGGSRSKYCSLPSDHMTAKERKEMSGEMIVVNMGKPMTKQEWEGLTLALKKEYIGRLFTVYHARVNDIADMFNMDKHNVWRYFRGYGIDLKELAIKSRAYHCKSPSPEWKEFIAGVAKKVTQDVPEPVKEENVAPEPSESVKLDDEDDGRKVIVLEVVSGSLNYIGDPSAVFTKAIMALDPSKQYHIQIRFKVKESE